MDGTDAAEPGSEGSSKAPPQGKTSDGASPDTSGAPATGSISFVTDSLSPPSSSAGAYFALSSYPDACTHRVEGSCKVDQCPSTKSEGPLTYLAAGAMSFSGFATPVKPSPSDGDPVAYQATQDGTLWSGGQILDVSAAGSTIPAFKASVVFPSPLELLSPASVSTISTSEGLSLTWQETSDDVAVLFSQLTTAGAIVDISCTVTAPSTGYTLTPAMLAEAVPDSSLGPNDNVLMVYSYRSRQVTAGSCEITVDAIAGYGRYDWPVSVTE